MFRFKRVFAFFEELIEMMKKKSICFISPFIGPLLDKNDNRGTGGAERQFYLFGKELAKRGWVVSYVLKKEKNEHKPIWPDWCSVFPVNIGYLGGSNWNFVPGMFSFVGAMLKSKSAFYVVKTPAFLLLPMLIIGKLFRRKIVFWTQLDRDAQKNRKQRIKLLSMIQNFCLHRVDVIISQTEAQAKLYRENLELKSIVVANIISQDYFQDDKEKKGYLLWMGNSLSTKRQEVLIELAKILPQYNFVMGMYVADLERFDMARVYSKKIDNLRFLGTVKPSETQKWFNEASVFVHTARVEGFPNTFLQSWQGRTPVITLNIDPDNIIMTNELGHCIGWDKVAECNESPIALARLLVPFVKKYMEDGNLLEETGLRSEQFVKNNHSSEIVLKKLENALDTFGLSK